MARLPRLSGREVVRVFESLGWEKVRQSSSHIILVREAHQATLSVRADHSMSTKPPPTPKPRRRWLQFSLRKIRIPLRCEDADVPLNLQTLIPKACDAKTVVGLAFLRRFHSEWTCGL